MLNEVLEFQSYTYPADCSNPDTYNKYPECLKMRILGRESEFNGLRTPLVVIARHFLCKKENLEDKLSYAENALRLWVGGKATFDRDAVESIYSLLSEDKTVASNTAEKLKTCIREYIENQSELDNLKESLNAIKKKFYDESKKAEIEEIIKHRNELASDKNFNLVRNWLPNYIRFLAGRAVDDIKEAADNISNDASDKEDENKLHSVFKVLDEERRKELTDIINKLKTDLSDKSPDSKAKEQLSDDLKEFVEFNNSITHKYGLYKWPDFLKNHKNIEYAAEQYKENGTLEGKVKKNVLDLLNADEFKECQDEDEGECIKKCLAKFAEYKNRTCFRQDVDCAFGAAKNIIELCTNLKKLPSDYAHKTFVFKNSDAKSSDFNSITYEEILMEAFNIKPENRYYLFQKEALKFDKSITKNQDNDTKNHVDFVLKMISTYLMKKNNAEHFKEGFLPCPKNEILNWCEKNFKKNEHGKPEIYLVDKKGKKIINKNNKEISKKEAEEKYKPLFITVSGPGNQPQNLFSVDPDILECFRLVPENEFDDFCKTNQNEKWIYYSDCGFEKSLTNGKNKKYKNEKA